MAYDTFDSSRYFIPIITAEQAREFDAYTINTIGVPARLLIESAGASVAHHAIRLMKIHGYKGATIFVGPGNNGADAIVAARYLLAHEIECAIFLLGDEDRFSADLAFLLGLLRQALRQRGLSDCFKAAPFSAIDNCIIIDGIFGAGLSRPPANKFLAAINFINNFRKNHPSCRVLSIDIPSGLNFLAHAVDHPFVYADITVTFGNLKPAHVSEPTKVYCGKVITADIGFFRNSPITNWYHQSTKALHSLKKPLAKNAHKGDFGHVLVYEGHPQYIGASRLAARAALRVGAGLVTIAQDVHTDPISLDLAEFMRKAVPEIDAHFMKRIDAMVLGPGLGKDPLYVDKASKFLESWHNDISSLVLDADGLCLLEKITGQMKIVATPHPKEASALLNCDVIDIERDRFKAINDLGALSESKNLEVIWLLKGGTTLVRAMNGEIYIFRGELPILATGGSGDVLSGAIAGLVKQTASLLSATLLAVSLQIEAANSFMRRTGMGKGSLPSELADTFPKLLQKPIK